MAKCKGCGRTIVWGVNEEGKRIPLDPSAPCYSVEDESIPGGSDAAERARVIMKGEANVRLYRLAFVSHFATCPNANQFSGRNRKPEGGEVR
jgi:hypothetical protein